MGRFGGQIAVVTAAASGIGQAIAHRLAKEGALVVAIGRTSRIGETAEALRQTFGKGESPVADCTDRSAVEAAFASIHDRHGHIDILVNAVGRSAATRRGEFWFTEPEVWD